MSRLQKKITAENAKKTDVTDDECTFKPKIKIIKGGNDR